MKQDTKEIEKMKELMDQMERHPLTKQIKQEEAARVLKERQAAAARIKAVKEEAEATIPLRQADLAAVEAELKAHDEERAGIVGKLAAARVALMQERQRLDREKDIAEASLLTNYHEAIDQAILWFRDKHDALRQKTPDHSTHRTGTNLFSLTKELVTYSNVAAIKGALTYCRVAIETLEVMKLVPSADLEKIEKLKSQIPDVYTLTEYVAEKPMERQAPTFVPPSDYEIERLLKKKI